MPVSVVVGGQFGSEGKGKIALEIVRRETRRATVVRVGGPNSGHTGYARDGRRYALRQLPAGCIDRNVDVVFPAGSYIDPQVLFSEITELEYPTDRIFVSPYARIITEEHKGWEREAGLVSGIGSTGSGVGAAVMASVARGAGNFELPSPDAAHFEPLERFICDTTSLMRKQLDNDQRIVIEGSQGFGLSLLDGGYWPKATSRTTTAAGALAEAGLSPIDVDDVTMVIRSYPIRVAGDSGALVGETTWENIAAKADRSDDLREYTTVTNNLRRVGLFDSELVCRALIHNNPSRLVLNHLDYVGRQQELSNKGSELAKFVSNVERGIGRKVDWLGFSGLGVVESAGRV